MRHDIFISYARSDSADLAKHLYADLIRADYNVFLDTESIVPGKTWDESIQAALNGCRVFLAILSKGYLASEGCKDELLTARSEKTILPLRTSTDLELPWRLTRIQYLDITPESYKAAFPRLRHAIAKHIRASNPKATLTVPFTVEPLPDNYLDRPDQLAPLLESVLSPESRRNVALTAIDGMGGVGKTILARALCHEPAIRDAFPDGILWFTIGVEPPDLDELLRQAASKLGAEPNGHDPAGCYREALRDKAALIVLDDVWQAYLVAKFRAESPRSLLLFTTRDSSIATGLGARNHNATLLTRDQSRRMLALWSGRELDELPPIADEIIEESGSLPLALSTIGASLVGKPPRLWAAALQNLRQARLDLVQMPHAFDPKHVTLYAAIGASVDALAETDPLRRDRYLALAIFPEDTTIHLTWMRTVWQLGEWDALSTIERFVDLSIATRAGEDTYRLHDLQHDYIRAQYTDAESLHLIHGAFRLSANVINRDPSQLSSQLTGRLIAHQERETISSLLSVLCAHATAPCLLPTHPALIPSGGPLLCTLEGHTSAVNSVAVSTDGRRAVSGSDDKTVKVWDVESGRELRTLKGHSWAVNSVGVSADGRRAVSGSADKTVKVWDLESGRELRTLKGRHWAVQPVAISADGRRAVSGSDEDTVKVWDLESGRELRTLKGHSSAVRAVAVTADGRRAVSGSDDKTVKVWDVESGRELRTLKGHSWAVNSVGVTADGRRAVSGSDDKTVKVWDLESGRELRTLEGHSWAVNSVGVSADGRRAVSGSDDETVKVWDLESGRELRTLEGHVAPVWAVAVTADGRRAVSSSSDHTLKVWELESGHEHRAPKARTELVESIAVTADNRRAVSVSEGGTLKVWDLESGRELQTLDGHTRSVRAVAVTPEGGRAVSISDDQTVRVWNLRDGSLLLTLAEDSTALGIASGGRVVSVINDLRRPSARLWQLDSGRLLKKVRLHFAEATALAVCPEGNRAIVLGSAIGGLTLLDLEIGRAIPMLGAGALAVAVTADGRRAVAGCDDRTVKVWDLESGSDLLSLRGHSSRVESVAVTADGRRAVSGSSDNTLKIWDLESGRELRTLEGHVAPVWAVAVTADGRRAVSAAHDKTVKAWDLESGACRATFTAESDLRCWAVTPDGQTILAGDYTGRLHFLRLID